METQVINNTIWRRISGSLYQKTSKTISFERINEVVDKLKILYGILGPYSQTRSMLSMIGQIMLNESFNVYVPVCPDYSHVNKLYTMKSVSNGISLVAEIHINFLLKIKEIIPSLNVTFIIADHESNDLVLCNKMGISTDEFKSRINESKIALAEFVEPLGWYSKEMSDVVPDLTSKELEYSSWISNSPQFARQINYDTMKRDALYRKIDHNLSWEDKRKRTIHTAAQYYCLGRFVSSIGSLICNHTTTNLAWYVEAKVAVIENPVVIY
jgi:hypothetical protein